MEDALRASERRLRQETQLVELSRDPIFIWDYDGTILEWNRGSEELYGYSRDEAVGKRKDLLLGTIVPGGSFADLRVKLLDEGNWNGELKHRTKAGRELTVESRIILEKIGGRRLAVESTRDVTERKAWETQQQLLLRELTHRVKNTLTVVQSIAHQTRRFSKSYEEFTDRLMAALPRWLRRTRCWSIPTGWAPISQRWHSGSLSPSSPAPLDGSGSRTIQSSCPLTSRHRSA